MEERAEGACKTLAVESEISAHSYLVNQPLQLIRQLNPIQILNTQTNSIWLIQNLKLISIID